MVNEIECNWSNRCLIFDRGKDDVNFWRSDNNHKDNALPPLVENYYFKLNAKATIKIWLNYKILIWSRKYVKIMGIYKN